MWPDRRLLDLFGIEHPIILAPMGGAMDWELTTAVAEAGGLGSLPCMMWTPEKVREEIGKIRARTKAPINLGFFTHKQPGPDNAREASWRDRLKPYFAELSLDPNAAAQVPARSPFNDEVCSLVEELKPAAVSFHFGLPEASLVKRVKAAGAKVIASATTVAEARWLEEHGADVIIAQGVEAGGHRGIFLSEDISSQAGTFALVPQVVDAVKVPVIAAGAVADARGIAAAFALGASGVQLGTAYLHCPEFEDLEASPPGAEGGQRKLYGAHQHHDRPARARHREPADPRAGANRGSAGLSECGECARAIARGGGESGLRRILSAVVWTGGKPRAAFAGG